MVERPPLQLGVLISGTGTNLQAIIDAIERGYLRAEIRVVISNRPDAYGLERARRHGVPFLVIRNRDFPTREAFDKSLVESLQAHGVEMVACAGFDRLLSNVLLDAFAQRVMNIHPALLPSFPGLHAQKAAFDHGVRFAGCSVFFVAAGVDDGPIIVQAVVPVWPDDDEERLTQRILTQEHRIYPYALRLYQEGRLEVQERKVLVRGVKEIDTELAIVNPPLP